MKPDPKFHKWLARPKVKNAPKLSFENTRSEVIEETKKAYEKNIRDKRIFDCAINNNTLNKKILDKVKKDSQHVNINTLTINNNKNLNLKNINIKRIDVSGQYANKSINIENCWIDELSIGKDAKANLNLRNCHIGKLTINPRCLHNSNFEHCCILSINCPPPSDTGENPFTGEFLIKNCYLPSKDNEYKGTKTEFQHFTNIRAHLSKLQNIEASSLFHVAEMRLERPYHTPIDKLFSLFYDFFSSYGHSISKPMLWLSVLFFACALTFSWHSFLEPLDNQRSSFIESVNQDCPKGLNGSETKLLDKFCFSRSLWFSSEFVFNPIGLLFHGGHFEPTSLGLMLAYTIMRIFGVVLWFFLLLALRRKFRLPN